jgi:putative oligomerization/nucleic acid binding protein
LGLIGGIARTAVVAGTATAVSNRVALRQQERWAEQGRLPAAYQAPVEPEPAPAGQGDPIDRLKELGALRDQGILTEEEFAAQKAKILGA